MIQNVCSNVIIRINFNNIKLPLIYGLLKLGFNITSNSAKPGLKP